MVFMKKKTTKEEIKNYKMTEREVSEKFANLSNDKLHKKVANLFMLKIMS